MRRFWLATCCLFLTGTSAFAQVDKPLSMKEYDAYNAVFEGIRFPRAQVHIVIAATTLNTGCGEGSLNPVLINNCGMFVPPATEKGIYEEARKAWPNLSSETWSDLLRKSHDSITLQDRFQTSFVHQTSDLKSKGEGAWAKPDAAIFLSNVGFDSEQRQALVYFQVFSYMTGVPTSGDLFLLSIDGEGKWQVSGRLTLLQMGG